MKVWGIFSLLFICWISQVSSFARAGVLDQYLQNSLKVLENFGVSNQPLCSVRDNSDDGPCDAVSRQKVLIDDAYVKKDRGLRNSLEAQFREIYSQCLDERFKSCYPNLKTTISLNDLDSLFQSMKVDPRFRYPIGGFGMCHYRAENLSYFLAEAGYKTKTIRITHSPTLIAMDRNSDGSLNGNYDDYHGYHTLVQIDVMVKGKAVPYLLDPQYMEKALPQEEYFKTTMGQNCQKLNSENDEFLDLTQCYFFEQKQNEAPESDLFGLFNDRNAEEDKPFLNCGWADGSQAQSVDLIKQMKASSKNDKIIHCTNGVTPEKFKDLKVTNKTYKELIEESYSSYENKLKQELEFAIGQVRMTKHTLDLWGENTSSDLYKEELESHQEWKKEQEKIEFSLKVIPEMKKRVRQNLKKLP